MACRYEFLGAVAKDLYKLTRHDQPLLHAVVAQHIPAILKDPLSAGEPEKGDLAHVRGYDLNVRRVAYRLIYQVEGDVVVIIAIGPHDIAYQKAKRR